MQISPHLVDEVMLKEHLATMGEGVLNFPAKLPGTEVEIMFELASLIRVRRSISFVWSTFSIPEILYSLENYSRV